MAALETLARKTDQTPFGNRVAISLATLLFTSEVITLLCASKPDPAVAIWMCTLIAAGTNWRWNHPGENHHSLIGHVYQAIE